MAEKTAIAIGHNGSGDDERCPVCRLQDALDAARAEIAELREALTALMEVSDERTVAYERASALSKG